MVPVAVSLDSSSFEALSFPPCDVPQCACLRKPVHLTRDPTLSPGSTKEIVFNLHVKVRIGSNSLRAGICSDDA